MTVTYQIYWTSDSDIWRVNESYIVGQVNMSDMSLKGPVTRKMFPFDDVIMSLGLTSFSTQKGHVRQRETSNISRA